MTVTFEFGDESVANSITAGNQHYGKVTAPTNARHLVKYEKWDPSDPLAVYGRIINADGSAVTSDFQISQSRGGAEWKADALALPDGRFLVMWDDAQSGGGSIW